jgi:type I restriction enzyme M protein
MRKVTQKTLEDKIANAKEGYIIDYVTGKEIKATPEEEVRQTYEKKLVEEYGYSKNQIDINFMIQKGSQKIGPADIAVFRDKRKTFDNIYIIVETKRRERKDGLDQLKSYLSPTSAEFGVWFNGKEIVHLQNLRKAPYFREIPDIPKKGETLEDVGLYQKKDLKPATELKTVFEVCHNYIYANEGLLKERTFNEVLKLIFIKMVDEKSASPKCEFRITDKEMGEIETGKENAFTDRILGLFERVKREYSDVFDPNERINLKPVTIAFVVSQLQKYSLINTPADVKGTAFQTFVHAHERGERGEFFTPYPILQLGVKMLAPKDDEMIIDPACGSGGFLIQSMKDVWNTIDKSRPDLSERTRSDMKIRYAHVYIKGIDINPDLARVSKMYMVLYDDGHTGIFATNSLEPFEKINERALSVGAGRIKSNSFDVVLTNPPFGTKGKVTDKTILRQFELGHKWKKDKKTGKWIKTTELQDGQTPEILFIERCLQFLKDGGRMAIVLPDGILTNLTLEHVQEFMLNKARFLAVVSLPQETFIPHGAGTKTSVVFLQKFEEEELEKLKKKDYPIFRAVCKKIGYNVRGRAVFKKNEKGEYLNEKGKVVKNKEDAAIDSDIQDILDAFTEFKKKHGLKF